MSRAPAAPRRLHGRALHLDGGADVGGAGDGVGGRPLPSFVAAQGATTLPPPCLKGAFRIFRPRRAADKFGEACVIFSGVATHEAFLDATVAKASKAAKALGVKDGMPGRDALALIK